MDKYYLGQGNKPLTEENGLREYNDLEEAGASCYFLQLAIMDGDFTPQTARASDSRQEIAESFYIYGIDTQTGNPFMLCNPIIDNDIDTHLPSLEPTIEH